MSTYSEIVKVVNGVGVNTKCHGRVHQYIFGDVLKAVGYGHVPEELILAAFPVCDLLPCYPSESGRPLPEKVTINWLYRLGEEGEKVAARLRRPDLFRGVCNLSPETHPEVVWNEERVTTTVALSSILEVPEVDLLEVFLKQISSMRKGEHYYHISGAELRDYAKEHRLPEFPLEAAIFFITKAGAHHLAVELVENEVYSRFKKMERDYFNA